ncbi:MAG: MBL fold metallo-hydrolase, partial [Candidatus Micrarchaeaceae archaeon]
FWIGNSGFYIKHNDYTVFIDPFRVSDSMKEKADLILITHAHFDHWSPKDIDRISKDGTKMVVAPLCVGSEKYKNVTHSKPGFDATIDGIRVSAIPAYNVKQERLQFHPRSNDWVGYIMEIEGMRVYHAGDTDFIPEMKGLKDIDVALLPMGGTYTMDTDEMIEAAKAIRPRLVVPIHYKDQLGKTGAEMAEKKLKEHLDNVLLMREVQPPTYSFS